MPPGRASVPRPWGAPDSHPTSLHRLHPASLLVLPDTESFPASRMGQRLVVAAFCCAGCVERAVSVGLGAVQGLSAGEKMRTASVGAARLAGAELLLPSLPTSSLLERGQR